MQAASPAPARCAFRGVNPRALNRVLPHLNWLACQATPAGRRTRQTRSMTELASTSAQISACSSSRPAAAPTPGRSGPSPAHARAGSACSSRPRSSPAASSRHARSVVTRAVATSPKERQKTELPEGYARYETMLILRPDLRDEQRDAELKKVDDFLEAASSLDVNRIVKGSQQLAYPIQKFWEGVYVLYTYAALPSTVVALQKKLSTPVVGEDQNWLRYMTFLAG